MREAIHFYSEGHKLVTLSGFGHYEVYAEPAFSAVMNPTVAWFEEHLPAIA